MRWTQESAAGIVSLASCRPCHALSCTTVRRYFISAPAHIHASKGLNERCLLCASVCPDVKCPGRWHISRHKSCSVVNRARTFCELMAAIGSFHASSPTSPTSYSVKSFWTVALLIVLGGIFHLIYINSIFDIYFRSPVVHGMAHVDWHTQSPASRVVVIVGK